MTLIRRTLAVLGSMAAIVVSTSLQAAAAFQDSAAVQTTVATGTVTRPGWVSVNDSCSTTSTTTTDPVTGLPVTTYQYWYTATVTWGAGSAPKGVSGYRVMAHLNNGQSFTMTETAPSTRTVSQTVDRAYLGYQPRLSVLTLTGYGWTAETPRTAVLAC
jgi:hypothetical protein